MQRPPVPGLPFPTLRPILFGQEVCQDLKESTSREWIVTNGLGGYASSTLTGLNSRRSHGLLVAATHPPVGRIVTLSKIEETIVIPGGRYELATNRYADVVHPEGYHYLEEFRLDPWPTFFYRVGEILLEKSIFMLPGENATVVGYTLHAATGPVELVLRPLVALRPIGTLRREEPDFKPRIEEAPGVFWMTPSETILPSLVFHHTAELVERSPCWYKNFGYDEESGGVGSEREDLWSPGNWIYLLKVGESCAFVASTGRRGTVDLTFHRRRLENTQTVLAQTMTPPGKGSFAVRLSCTSELFVARGEAGEKFLLAGFPGLSSWGRDALIALPGLTLATQRFDLARSILETLSAQIKGGLIPVRLSEEDGSPEYDSADTSLWFFWAVWHYWKATKDLKFISKKLLDPLREIIEGYLEGTSFGIRMDEDGLILLPDEQVPLTWMDAREPSEKEGTLGKAVSVRSGKPVEVNALWYCTLNIMARLAQELGLKRASAYTRLSRLISKHFLETFVLPDGVICDRVIPASHDREEGRQDVSIRPNMLIAASLPFSPLSRSRAASILNVIEKHLVTPVGIRTLTPKHPDYRGQYAGEAKTRSQASHQGTVWTWLIGPYVSTLLKVHGLTSSTKAIIRRQLAPFLPSLEESCLGSVPTLFDGDSPHTPRGALSRAWDVGELLRVVHLAKVGDL